MSRNMLLGVAAAIVLLAGTLLYLRPSRQDMAETNAPVSIVRAGAAAAPTPAPSTPATAPPTAAALSPVAAPADHIPEDPDLQRTMLSPDFDPRVLYGRLRAEPIDRPWAERSRRAIDAALASIPYLARDHAPRIACASTLCEIRGQLVEGTNMENTNVAMQALQGERFTRALSDGGLEQTSSSFGGDKAVGFTIYARRR